MRTWRLLDLPPLTAAENMALDEVLLELKGEGADVPNTLRFLQFSPRAVLVGFHQSVAEEVRVSYCRANGIDINRRITGGGGLLFDESQIGWEIICDKAFFDLVVPTDRLFRELCRPVVAALRAMGIDARFRPRNDIEVAGRKLSGTGGTDHEGAFLFQGTLLTDFDVETMLKSLRIPVEKLKAKEVDSVKKRVTCLAWELGRAPEPAAVKAALARAFARHLGVRLEPAGLTPEEKRLLAERLPYFRSKEWIDLVNPKYEKTEVVQAAYKSPNGLARCTLAVNLPRKVLKNVFITGDFLSFPSRALFDLEAALRGLPLNADILCGVIRGFFDDGRIAIPGMEAEDLCKPIRQALEKAAIARHGIPLEYCNQISLTNGSFDEVIAHKPSALLLPYCSKLKDCDLRFSKDCRACGQCTVGQAWAMGQERNMRNVCVTSFEDLLNELAALRRDGAKAFIGCCCQPFFTKHVDDFAKAGLPGILVNIDDTTCYDLSQEDEAHQGSFASQTHLNLGLLAAVLDAARA
ncbi:MAG: lipoyl protein ligase domain-containing protein [Solidesulfovibrio sp. DCME]|uniref:lipoate--protein ligase family protein n=1 Tax=Solidesulfovibrio sp. DCME TaxID=3447380 RepID=UPI003D0D8030